MAGTYVRDDYVTVRLAAEDQEKLDHLRDAYTVRGASNYRWTREEMLRLAVSHLHERLRVEGRVPDPDPSLSELARFAAERASGRSRSR